MSRTFQRIQFYGRGLFRLVAPSRLFRREMRDSLRLVASADIRERVDYCCKIEPAAEGAAFRPQGRIGDIPLTQGSRYHADLLSVARGLGPSFRIDVLFGDIIHVPPAPTIVKSRPIRGANANSVILPLDRLRHFQFPHDPVPPEAKRPYAVWRGTLNNPVRALAVKTFGAREDHDIGHISAGRKTPFLKPRLSRMDQYRFRYILSLEGEDVATNLKWVMASNSVAVSPPLQYETWFMEGRLIPDVHFVGVEPDLSDLDEKIGWYESNPDALERVRRAAHDWVSQFRDWPRQEAIARLVMLKYAQASGQWPDWCGAEVWEGDRMRDVG